MFLLFM